MSVKQHHVWMEIESNEFGQPTKYKCVDCLMVREIKSRTKLTSYFDQLNSIINRIHENKQKLEFIKLNPIGINEKLHINLLLKENKTLSKLYTFGV